MRITCSMNVVAVLIAAIATAHAASALKSMLGMGKSGTTSASGPTTQGPPAPTSKDGSSTTQKTIAAAFQRTTCTADPDTTARHGPTGAAEDLGAGPSVSVTRSFSTSETIDLECARSEFRTFTTQASDLSAERSILAAMAAAVTAAFPNLSSLKALQAGVASSFKTSDISSLKTTNVSSLKTSDSSATLSNMSSAKTSDSSATLSNMSSAKTSDNSSAKTSDNSSAKTSDASSDAISTASAAQVPTLRNLSEPSGAASKAPQQSDKTLQSLKTVSPPNGAISKDANSLSVLKSSTPSGVAVGGGAVSGVSTATGTSNGSSSVSTNAPSVASGTPSLANGDGPVSGEGARGTGAPQAPTRSERSVASIQSTLSGMSAHTGKGSLGDGLARLTGDECRRNNYCAAPLPDTHADAIFPPDETPNALRLVHVSAVVRHGDRTPFLRLATDDATGAAPAWASLVDTRRLLSVLPGLDTCPREADMAADSVCAILPPPAPGAQSPGMLTTRGWRQMEDVGRALRRMYVSRLFSGAIDADDVVVRSTPVPRTLLSAAALVEGLGLRVAGASVAGKLSPAATAKDAGVRIEVLPWRTEGGVQPHAWYAEHCPRLAELQRHALTKNAAWDDLRSQMRKLTHALQDRIVLRATLRDAFRTGALDTGAVGAAKGERAQKGPSTAKAVSTGGWLRGDADAVLFARMADVLRARACHGVDKLPSDIADLPPDVEGRMCALSSRMHAFLAAELASDRDMVRLAASGILGDTFRAWMHGALPRLSVLAAHDTTLNVLLAVLRPPVRDAGDSTPADSGDATHAWPGYASTLLLELWRGPRTPRLRDSADADAAGALDDATDSDADAEFERHDRGANYHYVRVLLDGAPVALPWCAGVTADAAEGAKANEARHALGLFCPLPVFMRHIGAHMSVDRARDCAARSE